MYAQDDSTIKENFQVADVLIFKKSIKKYIDSITARPDVVALSCYVWNWEYNKRLASAFKERWPDCLIVVGGPNVDKRDTEFFSKYPQFDLAVHGEGEISFREILLRYLSDQHYDDIPKVVTHNTKHVKPATRDRDINAIPSPILTGFYDYIIEKTERDTGPRRWSIPYETLRGCPYSCTFCDIGDSYWTKITKFDIDRIKAEVDWMSLRRIEYVMLCDSNWGMLDRDVEITKYVIQKKLETGYPQIWDATWAKAKPQQVYEIAKLDQEAGTRLFKGITFSVQSLTEETEEAIRRKNIKPEVYTSYMERYYKENIPTYTELIWPMPGESYQSFKNVYQTLIDMGQKQYVQTAPLQITCNAEMGYKEYQEKYKMKLNEVLLDSYGVRPAEEHIDEYAVHVVGTSTASFEDIIRGHLFHIFMNVMFYFGWAHYPMEYLHNKHNINHVDFVEDLLTYFIDKRHTIIGSEICETKASWEQCLTEKKAWGRVSPNDDRFMERYETTTCIMFYRNRDRVKEELMEFIQSLYRVDASDVIRFNQDVSLDHRKKYPIVRNYSRDTLEHTIGIDQGSSVLIDHDRRYESEREFTDTTYFSQRKNRWWHCSATPLD